MRVLAFTPTYGSALRPETVASIVGQRWAGELVWEVGRFNPFPPPDLRNVVEQYRRGRERALAGGFDALWTVEHDVVLPPDALERLWGAGGAVVYGVYLFRHGANVVNALEWVGDRNIGMSLSLAPRALARAQRMGEVEVSGAGFGCTLMRREVLERIPFRPDGEQAPDIPFATDCLRAGVRQVARFDVLCGHVNDGEVLTMAEERGNGGVTVEVLQDVTAGVEGTSVRLVRGSVRPLPVETAQELARAGYVRIRREEAVEIATDAGVEGRETAVTAPRRRRR